MKRSMWLWAPVVLFFGYTYCPDVCPTTLAEYRRAKEQLGPLADQVRFVFVTVDPERDTRERLATYVEIFDEDFVGLTGDTEVLARMYEDFGVVVSRVDNQDSSDYWLNHTAMSYVVDKDGAVRLVHLFGMTSEDMAKDIAALVKG